MHIDELVSRCLGKSLKTKKVRTESRIKFDKSLGHWSAEIANPPEGSLHEDLTPQDYQVSKIDLGNGSKEVDMKIFEASEKIIVDRVWKDAQDNQDMKEAMRSMAQYISSILHLEPKALSEISEIVDVTSPTNK